jgi:hypothetical protein
VAFPVVVCRLMQRVEGCFLQCRSRVYALEQPSIGHFQGFQLFFPEVCDNMACGRTVDGTVVEVADNV